MFTMQFDEQLIEQLANKIADRATDILAERIGSLNNLPLIMTREEAMNVLRCGPTKMAELMARPDFPVNREFGVKIPTHMLMKWIEKNTNWMELNTNYFSKEAI
ncbi:hypothetical protein [Bacillus sp. S/N-304-OC-R1]|uniref:hypothetical protein n=1 Tax=Bacillus sp. S/N-304-OC-R1 TaxID=2758034 RepID=UPI001C8ED7A5|nr:hypothetical protein [Bacillus sp. S/N-304-OC-R1]MBY0122194.1 hypothetical protein [Bacillus sp. S/N-304-OC-R1]